MDPELARIDVAVLFIDATDFLLNACPNDVAVGNVESADDPPDGMHPCVTIRFQPGSTTFRIDEGYRAAERKLSTEGEKVCKTHPDYKMIIHLFGSVRRRYGYEAPLAHLAGRSNVNVERVLGI